MLIIPNLLIPALVYTLLPISAVAQDPNFTIPWDWRKPTFLNSSSERITIAQNAVEILKGGIDPSNGTTRDLDTWQSANVLASIAQLDYVSGTQENHTLVQQSVTAFQKSRPEFFDTQYPLPRSMTSDPLMWGLAAFYGARAYNDTGLLSISDSVWSLVQGSVVDNDTAASGTQDGTLCSPDANGSALVGAVFSRLEETNRNDFTSDAGTVGAYIALSAHLWNTTKDIKYLTSAEQSAQFINKQLYLDASEPQIIQHGFDLSNCSTIRQPHWTSDQGFFMEGLSILSVAPLASNSTWQSMLKALVSSTIQPSPPWTTLNGTDAGILSEGPDDFTQNSRSFDFRNIFISALLEIWSQTPSSDPMATFIEAFIAVQFNALRDHASVNDTYSPIWKGPPQSEMFPWGQLAAIPVLNAAVKIASSAPPPSNSSTGASSPTTSPLSGDPSPGSDASNSPRSLSGGAIAGIVIGSVGGFTLIVASAFLAVRYKRRLAKERQVAYQSFVPSAMYRQPAEMTGAVGLLPAEFSWKNEHGYGSGQRYLTERDSVVEPPATSPFAEQSSAE